MVESMLYINQLKRFFLLVPQKKVKRSYFADNDFGRTYLQSFYHHGGRRSGDEEGDRETNPLSREKHNLMTS